MMWQQAKVLLAQFAAAEVKPGMTLGIGSGTTVMAFIDALGQRMQKESLRFTAVAASELSTREAQARGITVVPLHSVKTIDWAVDGADAVDRHNHLIKGGGAALVRERLIMASADHATILIDGSKTCDVFRDVVVPLAVIPFGWRYVAEQVRHHALSVELRLNGPVPVTTDDGLYILDAHFDQILKPDQWHRDLKLIEGVADTGLFTNYQTQVWVSDGRTVALHHPST